MEGFAPKEKHFCIRFGDETQDVQVWAQTAIVDESTNALRLWHGDDLVGFFANVHSFWVIEERDPF